MAMLVIKSGDTTYVNIRGLYHYFCRVGSDADRLPYEVLVGAICAFEEGRLPGNLGDTPEALDTGEERWTAAAVANLWQTATAG